jgi:cupin 2 domain-containing protein
MRQGSLRDPAPHTDVAEFFETLIQRPGIRLERIVSRGQCSPEGFWYDQDETEWVMVLDGSARLRFETGNQLLTLEGGDWVEIPAHERHRVEWTDPNAETIWLAIFLR